MATKKKVKKYAQGGTFKAPNRLTPKAWKLKRDNAAAEKELQRLDMIRRFKRKKLPPSAPLPAPDVPLPAPSIEPTPPASIEDFMDLRKKFEDEYDNFPKTYSMKKGGAVKKKKAVKKMKHGGKVGKCPRDGIAMRGKTKVKKII